MRLSQGWFAIWGWFMSQKVECGSSRSRWVLQLSREERCDESHQAVIEAGCRRHWGWVRVKRWCMMIEKEEWKKNNDWSNEKEKEIQSKKEEERSWEDEKMKMSGWPVKLWLITIEGPCASVLSVSGWVLRLGGPRQKPDSPLWLRVRLPHACKNSTHPMPGEMKNPKTSTKLESQCVTQKKNEEEKEKEGSEARKENKLCGPERCKKWLEELETSNTGAFGKSVRGHFFQPDEFGRAIPCP